LNSSEGEFHESLIMKIRLKEDPKEWRKNTLLTALALAVLSSILRWRGILSTPTWRIALLVLALLSLAAWFFPRCFRAYYRASTRFGFWLSLLLARVILLLVFFAVITPLGWIFRLSGKDALRLKRSGNAITYWSPANPNSPLDRLF
jgi:Kef-type K+ transport system membrane component KefB